MRVCLLASLQGYQNTARMTGGCFDVRLSISGQREDPFSFSSRYSAVQHPRKRPQSPLSHNPRPRGPEATLHFKI